MYNKNSNSEVTIRLVGKLTLEFPDIDQLKVRNIIEETLYKYDVVTQETGLVVSDIEDKLYLYLACKKLDGLSKKTLYNYNLNLIMFCAYIRKALATVDSTDIRVYLIHRCKNMKAGSVNGQIYILKSFFSWLLNEGYIIRSPLANIKATKEPKRLRHALEKEEIELLRQACETLREAALIEFLVSSGVRLCEVVGVNKSDINFYEMSLNVIGKGDKERTVYFNTKSKILLQKYIKGRKDFCEALFVTSKHPITRLGSRSIEREIKNIAERTEINKSIFPHLFRHSFATHQINAGMPLPILQQLMGHECADTTMIYAEMSQDNIQHAYKISN